MGQLGRSGIVFLGQSVMLGQIATTGRGGCD